MASDLEMAKIYSYIHTACNGQNTNEIHALLGVAMAKSVDL